MRKICLIAVALFATTAAHAETSRGLIMTSAEAAPAQQPVAAVAQPAPAVAPAPAPAPAPAQPATTIFQTTNPQAQMVVKQLEAHGLIKAPPQQTAQASTANVVTLPAPGQPAQVQAVQTQPAQVQQPVQTQPAQTPVAQTQVVAQPVAAAAQPQVAQPQPTQTYTTASKPVVRTRHETDEAKARRIAARYGIHW